MDAFGRPVGGSQDAQAAIAEYIMGTVMRGATNKDGVIDPAMFGKLLETYRPALENALTSQRQNFAARDALGKVATSDKAGNWQLSKAQREFPAIPEQAVLPPDEMARLGASQQDLKRVLDTANMLALTEARRRSFNAFCRTWDSSDAGQWAVVAWPVTC